jgi:D-psicose/D-tagatose/L-ribulose 3-epimerase
MQYAISNWIYGNEPLRDQFTRLAQYGYEGIELVGEPDRYSIPEVKGLCKEFGVRVSSILGWSIWGIPGRDSASRDEKERSAALEYGKSCVELASALEAPILVVLPGPAGRTAPSGAPKSEKEWLTGYQTELELAVSSLRNLAAYAQDHNVVLGLEPINRYETFLIYNVDQALRFVEQVGSENLKIHLDTFHMNIDEANLADAVHKAGPLLVSRHVSDSNREAPGRGHIDFTSLIQALNNINYRGFLTLEPVPPGSDPLLISRMSKHAPLRDIYAQESISHLRELEKKALRA